MRAWLDIPDDTPFPVTNLPYGVFSVADEQPRVGVAIGDHVLDLAPVAAAEVPAFADVFAQPSLDAFLALGRAGWAATRERLLSALTDEAHRGTVEGHLLRRDDVRLHLPFTVADYVDFYASLDHAETMGRLFRPGSDPLPPAWRHQPLGYHGRAGTVVVSGTPVARPCGQRRVPGTPSPAFGPSTRLDIEAEVGFVVGVPSLQGRPVSTADLAEHVFGVVLVNDWSARDLQAWESLPLGPFLGKSFATSVSAWVVPLDALAAAWVPAPRQEPEVLPYLRDGAHLGLDITLEVAVNGTVVSRPPFASTYWTPAQQLAHLTVNGASLRTGDLLASGTVSGPDRQQRGSLVELTDDGARPLTLADGSERGFLHDGDTVRITGWAPGLHGTRIGFGEVTGTVRPSPG